ncbi:MAG: hypothetical protein Q9227_002310 [Pyrenula ochraceoflavens]
MFRAQVSPFDDVVDRAKDAVASMIKRLAHRNANVQLYTLEVCERDLWERSHIVLIQREKVGECTLAELRNQHAPGAGIKKLYRCDAEACE